MVNANNVLKSQVPICLNAQGNNEFVHVSFALVWFVCAQSTLLLIFSNHPRMLCCMLGCIHLALVTCVSSTYCITLLHTTESTCVVSAKGVRFIHK